MNTEFEKKRKEGTIVIYRREFIFSLQSLFRELTITAKLLLIENIKFYCDV